jgi:hypothetical protein
VTAVDALFALVPPADRAVVRAKARDLAAGVATGQGLYRAGSVAVAVAAMAPWLSGDRLALLHRYCRWTVALDAYLDGAGDPVARGLWVELAGIRAELAGYDRVGLLAGFGDALGDAVASAHALRSLSARVARGQEPAPSAEEYLDLASRDVNYRSVAVALLLLCGFDGRLDAVEPALAWACRAVRLANDLVTVTKDAHEGRLNVLGLRWRSGRPVVGFDVQREIDRCVSIHLRLAGRLPDVVSARALANSLHMAVGLFRMSGGTRGRRRHASANRSAVPDPAAVRARSTRQPGRDRTRRRGCGDPAGPRAVPPVPGDAARARAARPA